MLLVLAAEYLLVSVLVAAVVATAQGARFSLITVLVAALPGWLAGHQVPMTISGAPLGVLPLLPTVIVMVLIAMASAQVARRSRLRTPDQAVRVIAAMTLSHAMAGTVVALVLGGAVSIAPAKAFFWCGLVAALASAAGLTNRCGLTYLLWAWVDDDVWSGLRAGFLALAAALAAGTAVVLTALCLSLPEVFAVSLRAGGIGDAFGEMLLSILYLPGAVVAGWSFAAGPGLSLGHFGVSPFGITNAPVPSLPLLAALPSATARGWLVVFVLPAAVGALVGWWARRIGPELRQRLRAVAVAAMIASLATLTLASIVGGELGGGPFGPVTVRPGLLGLSTFCWVLIPAALVVWVAGPVEDDYETDELPEVAGEIPDTPEELLDSDEEPGDSESRETGQDDSDGGENDVGDEHRPG